MKNEITFDDLMDKVVFAGDSPKKPYQLRLNGKFFSWEDTDTIVDDVESKLGLTVIY